MHLSTNEQTAIKVGKRHGKPIVIQINAKEMNKDGIKFYLSNNNVWITDLINLKYFI